jgi:hypothetical protein
MEFIICADDWETDRENSYVLSDSILIGRAKIAEVGLLSGCGGILIFDKKPEPGASGDANSTRRSDNDNN